MQCAEYRDLVGKTGHETVRAVHLGGKNMQKRPHPELMFAGDRIAGMNELVGKSDRIDQIGRGLDRMSEQSGKNRPPAAQLDDASGIGAPTPLDIDDQVAVNDRIAPYRQDHKRLRMCPRKPLHGRIVPIDKRRLRHGPEMCETRVSRNRYHCGRTDEHLSVTVRPARQHRSFGIAQEHAEPRNLRQRNAQAAQQWQKNGRHRPCHEGLACIRGVPAHRPTTRCIRSQRDCPSIGLACPARQHPCCRQSGLGAQSCAHFGQSGKTAAPVL